MPTLDLGRIALHFEDAGSGGPPILLLHELGGSSESWAKVVPLLSPHRRTIVPDMRCAGRSEKPPGAFGIEDVADDLIGLLRALDIGSIDIVGGALGSIVGMLIAIRAPSLVRRLMLCAVAPDMAGTTREYLAARSAKVRTVGMRAVADASLNNSFPETHAELRREYRGIYLANDPNAYAELSLALARAELRPDDWRRVACPTLVAPGAHDFLWTPAIAQGVADLIPGAKLEVMHDAGHFPHLQAPVTLSRMALGFFAE